MRSVVVSELRSPRINTFSMASGTESIGCAALTMSVPGSGRFWWRWRAFFFFFILFLDAFVDELLVGLDVQEKMPPDGFSAAKQFPLRLREWRIAIHFRRRAFLAVEFQLQSLCR